MMTTNQEFKNSALSVLRGNWAISVLATLVYIVLMCIVTGATSIYQIINDPFSETLLGLSGGGSLILILLVGYPIMVGFAYSFCAFYTYSDSNLVQNTFSYGFKHYGRAIGGMLLVDIFTILWTLLFVIPGIVKAYSYALTPYILIDDPQISVREAIRKSQRMMTGQKFNLFYLQLSFIGWFLLSCISGGIGFLWLVPYYMTSQAVFYRNLKDNLPA
ncbi:MAG: DUF975 family protein [Candidatus Cryptobacteroides sp.]